jgi:lipopolysaccharide transport system ATP-binding protein
MSERSSRIKSRAVLNKIDLDIAPGESVGIVGANGSGKTTLLRVIAGIYFPDQGEVVIKGRVGMLLDSGYGLDHRLSGRRNCESRAILNRIPKSQQASFVNWVHSFSGIDEYFELPLSQYSSGMLTRLAFAMNVFDAPDIMVVDEGIGNSDSEFRERAFSRLDELCGKSSIVVFASHEKEILRRRCTRGVVMCNGEITYDGILEQALERA